MAFGNPWPARAADFRSEAMLCLTSDLQHELVPDHAMKRTLEAARDFLSSADRDLRVDYHAFRDRMLAVALGFMTEAERDERMMTKLGRLYGSSV